MSPSFFHDVTAGNNGYATSSGYDLATGRGSPKADLLVPALAGYAVGTHLAFASPPTTTITAGTSGLPTLTVHINDASGTLITTDNSAVTLSVYNGQGSGVTLNGGTVTVNAVNGVATFENLWITAPPNRSGTYQIVATDGTDIGATFSFDVVAASAHSAVTPSTVIAFNGASNPKGSTPEGGLVMDGAGNLYGTTYAGGTNGLGTIYKIDASTHLLSTLYSFDNATGDGCQPYCTMALDAPAGVLYGTTQVGGNSSSEGTVFKFDLATSAITFTSFTGSTSGQYPDGAVVLDGSGNVYGTTNSGSGSSNGGGTIFKYSSSGSLTAVYPFNGNAFNGRFPRVGLAIDAAGNLYGTTTSYSAGGSAFPGTVFELSGSTLTTLGVFTGPNGLNALGTLILDENGNLYGTTSQGGLAVGTGYGTVFEIVKDTKTITTLASFDDGLSGNPSGPYGGLVLDQNGNLFGTTYDGGASHVGSVFEIAAGTFTISRVASMSSSTTGSHPITGLTLDANGNLFGTAQNGGSGGDGTVFELANMVNPAWLKSGSAAVWSNSTQALTVAAVGSANFARAWVVADPHNTFSDVPVITVTQASGTNVGLRFEPTNTDTIMNIGGLTIQTGATAWLPVTPTADSLMLNLTTLNIDSSSQLDLGNNGLLLTYGSGTSPLPALVGWLSSGYNAGTWTGLGIVTRAGALNTNHTTGIGYADSADGTGTNPTSNSILLMYAMFGDASLNRTVGLEDYTTVVRNFGASPAGWDQGDFSYDGTVGLDDYTTVVRNYGGTV